MTIRLPEPERDRRAIRRADRAYREAQLYILRQCVPGAAYSPQPEDERTNLIFRAMAREGYLFEIEEKRYIITAKGQEYRERLQRPPWRQWLLDNVRWVIPTVVAVASTITAICAIVMGMN